MTTLPQDSSTSGLANPTVGILLCEHKDHAVVRHSVLHDSEQLFATKYRRIQPTEDELRREIERERDAIEASQRLKETA